MAYRLSRNCEASVIDKITADLVTDGWTGIRVEKSFSEAYKGELPCIVINVSDRPEKRLQVGSDVLSNFVDIEIRIFATSDGNRLDLSDYLLSKIMSGIPYYSYTITNGIVSSKVPKGRISILEIVANRKELRVTDNLVKEDRYRSLLSLKCRVALT